MARLEQAVKIIVELFVAHTDNDGQLSMEELKKLCEQEIQSPEMKAKISGGDFNKAMETLDKDSNGAIDFKEFLKVVSLICHSIYLIKTGQGEESED